VRYLLVTAQRQVGEPLSDYLGDPNIGKVYFLQIVPCVSERMPSQKGIAKYLRKLLTAEMTRMKLLYI
jgi:hypothetical protein